MSSLLKLMRFILLGLILTSLAIWLINAGWVQLILPSLLNEEIDRCRIEKDRAMAICMLNEAIKKYPEAPNRPMAEELLKTWQRQLTHSEELARIMDQANTTPQPSNAVALLKTGMNTYYGATNQEDAEELLTRLKRRQAETERLAIAIQYAHQSEDLAYCVKVLTRTLAESPNAANRQEAEELLARKKQLQIEPVPD